MVVGVVDRVLAGHAPARGPGRSPRGRGPGPGCDTSKRTWSLPLPVQPWATAWAPCVAGRLHQVLHDDRAGQGRHQRVAALVHGVGLEGGQHEVLGELLAGVDDDGVDRAGGAGPLADDVPVVAGLADVDGEARRPRRPAPRSSSARPRRCRDLRCRPVPRASPQSFLFRSSVSGSVRSGPGRAGGQPGERRRARGGGRPRRRRSALGHHHEEGVVAGDGAERPRAGRRGRGPSRRRGRCPAGCAGRRCWPSWPPRPPSRRRPGGGGRRGPAGPWAARGWRRRSRRRRPGP